MTASGDHGGAARSSTTVASARRVLRDEPLIPLTALLVALVVVLELAQPGIVNCRAGSA